MLQWVSVFTPFYCQIIFQYIDTLYLFFHSSYPLMIIWTLSTFWLLWIMLLWSFHAWVFVWPNSIFNSLGYIYLEVALLGYMVTACLTFMELPDCFPNQLHHCIIVRLLFSLRLLLPMRCTFVQRLRPQTLHLNRLGLVSWVPHLLVICPLANRLTFLCLTVHTCKMGIIIVPASFSYRHPWYKGYVSGSYYYC